MALNSYAPLHVGPVAEVALARRDGWWERAMHRVQVATHLRLYYRIPYGRVSVEHQLSQRDAFAEEQWIGFEITFVRQILAILKKEMNLPNDFFIPSDPLYLVLIPDYDDLPISSVRAGIRENTGIDVSYDEFNAMHARGDWTLGEFLTYLSTKKSRSC